MKSALPISNPLIENPHTAAILAKAGLVPIPQHVLLKGVTERVKIYEIP
jgi:hypothetical protein